MRNVVLNAQAKKSEASQSPRVASAVIPFKQASRSGQESKT